MKRDSNVKLNANIGEIRINNYDTAIKGNGYENLENDVVKLTKSCKADVPVRSFLGRAGRIYCTGSYEIEWISINMPISRVT